MNWYRMQAKQADALDGDLDYYKSTPGLHSKFSMENILEYLQTHGDDFIPQIYMQPQNNEALQEALEMYQGITIPYGRDPSGRYPQENELSINRLQRIQHDMGLITNEFMIYLQNAVNDENQPKRKREVALKMVSSLQGVMSGALTTLYKVVQQGDEQELIGQDILKYRTEEGSFNKRPFGGLHSNLPFQSMGLGDNQSSLIDWSKLINRSSVAAELRNRQEQSGIDIWKSDANDASLLYLETLMNINNPQFKELLENIGQHYDPEAVAAFLAATKAVSRVAYEGNVESLNNRGHSSVLPNFNAMRDKMGIDPISPKRQIERHFE